MRKSVDGEDEGFDVEAIMGRWDVMINGIVIKHCITADEEKGRALCYALDSNGNFKIDKDKGEIVKEWRTGLVRLIDRWADGTRSR